MVDIPSTQPRVIGQTAHEATQALAQSSHRKYTICGCQKDSILSRIKTLPRKLQIQTNCGAVRATRRRQRGGISSEIETFGSTLVAPGQQSVARGAASHLRLKQARGQRHGNALLRRQRGGISSEIETS